jgi:DNA-binding NtrC family response regulator
LFGHEKGSFTGATERRRGCIEMADRGTLFLDEIGEMPPPMQSKLLRFLQDHRFMRIGGRHLQQADVRVIGATNRDLKQGVAEGWFREDLFYRLNVVPIHIPPLRQRREDVPRLVEHFLSRFQRERRLRMGRVADEAMRSLTAYDWPGNVRELRNVVERIVVLHGDEEEMALAHLPPEVRGGETTQGADATSARPDFPLSLEDRVAGLERQLITQAMQAANGNLSQAALLLQTTRRKLKYKADQYGLIDGA